VNTEIITELGTSLMGPEVEIEADPLKKFREQVAAEKEAKPTGMSDKAAERLRAQNEGDRQRKSEDKEFVKGFEALIHDERLVALLGRISPGDDWGERNLLKLRRCLANGWKPTCPHDVVFFARLTADEEAMSLDKFYREMTSDWPTTPSEDGVKMGDCRAGKACKWLKNRRPRQAPEGQFCTAICRQSFLAVQKRAKAGVTSVN